MNILIPVLAIGTLYGLYDFFIKLSAARIEPTIGALICQLFSAATIVVLISYKKFIQKASLFKTSPQGITYVAVAGILIGLALVSLFIFFQNKNVKATTAFPTITALRNLTLIIMGIFVLKENLSFSKTIGLFFSLLGIYLLMI